MKPETPSGFWRSRWKSFTCAGRGVVLLVRTQVNARIHLLTTVAVVATGIAFHITRGEWVPLIFAIGIVWIAEALNTAIEHLADRITGEQDEQICRAKDISAGAVLLAAITAAAIGFAVLGPHVWAMLCGRSG